MTWQRKQEKRLEKKCESWIHERPSAAQLVRDWKASDEIIETSKDFGLFHKKRPQFFFMWMVGITFSIGTGPLKWLIDLLISRCSTTTLLCCEEQHAVHMLSSSRSLVFTARVNTCVVTRLLPASVNEPKLGQDVVVAKELPHAHHPVLHCFGYFGRPHDHRRPLEKWQR